MVRLQAAGGQSGDGDAAVQAPAAAGGVPPARRQRVRQRLARLPRQAVEV